MESAKFTPDYPFSGDSLSIIQYLTELLNITLQGVDDEEDYYLIAKVIRLISKLPEFTDNISIDLSFNSKLKAYKEARVSGHEKAQWVISLTNNAFLFIINNIERDAIGGTYLYPVLEFKADSKTATFLRGNLDSFLKHYIELEELINEDKYTLCDSIAIFDHNPDKILTWEDLQNMFSEDFSFIFSDCLVWLKIFWKTLLKEGLVKYETEGELFQIKIRFICLCHIFREFYQLVTKDVIEFNISQYAKMLIVSEHDAIGQLITDKSIINLFDMSDEKLQEIALEFLISEHMKEVFETLLKGYNSIDKLFIDFCNASHFYFMKKHIKKTGVKIQDNIDGFPIDGIVNNLCEVIGEDLAGFIMSTWYFDRYLEELGKIDIKILDEAKKLKLTSDHLKAFIWLKKNCKF